MKYRINIAIGLLLILFGSYGCKKLDLSPTDRFSELNFWEFDDNVNNALNNIYAGMYQSNYVFYNEGLSDNAAARSGDVDLIASGNFTVDNNRFKNEWSYYFGGIKSCNIFLENIDKNQTLSDSIKTRMKGEARFVRAWLHFHLMNWWGDIPILPKDITADEAKTISRSPKADALKFILDELDTAATMLPANTQYGEKDLGRITKGAAEALKARVLLYQGDRMEEVASICEGLIQGDFGTYDLADSYSDLFSDEEINNSSNEVILSLQFAPSLKTWGDYFDFAPISAGARTSGLAPSQELVNSYIMLNGKNIDDPASGYDEDHPYANRDPRLTYTVVYDGYNWENIDGSFQTIYIKPGSTPAGESSSNEYSPAGQGSITGYYWRKYWDPDQAPGMEFGNNIILLRWAEVLLDYAEAKESLGQLDESVWNETVRKLRERAGFTDSKALEFPTSGSLKEIIRNERRSEFAFEGLRIDDIRRWKISEDVLNGWLHGAQFGDAGIDNGFLRVKQRKFDPSSQYLWPVPSSEISLNPNLKPQNPNY